MHGTWLNIGCGTRHLPGFVNMDIDRPYDRKLDARRPLPYADQSVSGVYSEHFIEHLSQSEGYAFFRECRRVLHYGGVLRVATPDLSSMVDDYLQARVSPDWIRHGYTWTASACERFNIGVRAWGHQWIYDETELLRMATAAGLAPLKRQVRGESDIPEFRQLESREGSRLILEFVNPDRRLAPESTPLVSVLIAAYKPDFFREALESALRQSYTHIEIIVSDDSEADAIQAIVEDYRADGRVTYVRNPQRLAGRVNMKQCFRLATGEFVKFLNDDDLLHPDCISRMLDCYREWPGVTMVTSHRQRIDLRGKKLADTFGTRPLLDGIALLNGTVLAGRVIAARVNFLGEQSTVLFRKQDLEQTAPDIMSFGGYGDIRVLCDVAMWLNLMCKGHVAYISDSLSAFRIHAGQGQRASGMANLAKIAWGQLWQAGLRWGLVGRASVSGVSTLRMNATSWRVEPLARINLSLRLAAAAGVLYRLGYAALRRVYHTLRRRGLIRDLT